MTNGSTSDTSTNAADGGGPGERAKPPRAAGSRSSTSATTRRRLKSVGRIIYRYHAPRESGAQTTDFRTPRGRSSSQGLSNGSPLDRLTVGRGRRRRPGRPKGAVRRHPYRRVPGAAHRRHPKRLSFSGLELPNQSSMARWWRHWFQLDALGLLQQLGGSWSCPDHDYCRRSCPINSESSATLELRTAWLR